MNQFKWENKIQIAFFELTIPLKSSETSDPSFKKNRKKETLTTDNYFIPLQALNMFSVGMGGNHPDTWSFVWLML